MMSWTICRNLSGSASAPGRTDGDTGSELTFREYHELMGIYILIILIILFGMSSTRMIKLWLGMRTGLTHLSKSVRLRCACLLRLSIALLSERAATFPGPIPAPRHGSWKLNREILRYRESLFHRWWAFVWSQRHAQAFFGAEKGGDMDHSCSPSETSATATTTILPNNAFSFQC
jgi:hypothetical protein